MSSPKSLTFSIAALLCLLLKGPAFAEEPSLETIKGSGSPANLLLRGEVDREHVLEFSPNLREWRPILGMELPASPFEWNDPLSTSGMQGFYRLSEWSAGAPRSHAEDFRLIDHQGRSRLLHYHEYVDAIVLLFVDPTGDPAIATTLANLEGGFAEQDVEFWIIDPLSANRSDLVDHAEAWQTGMPILHDTTQLVARSFGVTHGTEAVLIDPASWEVVYQGAIEAPAGDNGPGQTYLVDAIDAFLAGGASPYFLTPSADYPIVLESFSPVSYEQEIAPLLIKNCVSCHSPGNIAPFTLSNYEIVRAFAHEIRHAVMSGEMPPWFADPNYGKFENDSSLSHEDKRKLIHWIDQGAPRGPGSDPLADHFAASPPPADYPFDWPSELGEPDMILSIPTQSIPANGEVDYKYIELRPNLPEGKHLRAAVIKPGNPEVVHHGLVFLGGVFQTFLQGAGLNGYFAGYVPGLRARAFPEGTGKFLSANPTLTLQMHYQTNGTAQTDKTQLGLYFHSAPPPMEYETAAASTTSINIQPGEREYTREASVVLSASQETTVYEFSPHMHYRGARMEYDAIYPDGHVEKLLSVPHYLFDWQLLYRLAEPKRLPAGTTIRVRGAFDNSAQNHENPNPGARVSFGEQSDDEMFIGYISFAVER